MDLSWESVKGPNLKVENKLTVKLNKYYMQHQHVTTAKCLFYINT